VSGTVLVESAHAAPARNPLDPPRRSSTAKVLLAKIGLLGAVNALAVYGLVATFGAGAWGLFVPLLVGTAVIDLVYAGRGQVPAKYLLPGTLFLLVFQVYVVLYTGFASFTNYGDGHNLSQSSARERILAVSERRVPDSALYRLTVLAPEPGAGGQDLRYLLTGPDGEVSLGDENGLQEVDETAVRRDESGRAVRLEGYTSLDLSQLSARQDEVLDARIPLGDADEGSLRTDDGSTAYVARSPLTYDAERDVLRDTDSGITYAAGDDGFYRSTDDGRALTPGWRVAVGLDNYSRVLADERIRGPFVSVFAWTFAFAALSVLFTFALGLLLAIALDDPHLRGRRLYRSLLVLPYAVPSFLSVLVWTGMLNPTFGFINTTLLHGAGIPWLTDAWLAKASVLLVNTWLGFPYMFLICTGALQSIPGELREAARVDGAGPLQGFRSITLPLLLVATAPLLIASFAFNFNNFTVIYFVTGGGPNIPEAPISVGSTDLLISMVYKLAFGGAGRQWGFACALSVVIFAIVATISAVGFRRTRSLEEVNA